MNIREIDGAPMASFVIKGGLLIPYAVVLLYPDDRKTETVIATIEQFFWSAGYNKDRQTVVWRNRPEIIELDKTPFIRLRFCVVATEDLP